MLERLRTQVSLVVLLTAGMCQWSTAASTQINPVIDNSIYSESNFSNGLGPLYAGLTPNTTIRRALIQFNIAGAIPTGSTINSVTLSLTLTKIGPAATSSFELHPISAAWGEGTSLGAGAGSFATTGDATWNHRLYSGSTWTTPGGDFGPASGSASFGTSVGTSYSFASSPGLVGDVQGWLNAPSTNFGWMLLAADESVVSAREFGSKDGLAAQRPVLTINYTAVPEPHSVGLLVCIGSAMLLRRRGLLPSRMKH